MRKALAGLVAGLVLGTTGVGMAATTGMYWSHKSDGVWCRKNSDTVACIPTTAHGYGVAINDGAVLVMNVDTEKTVFQRYQP